MARYIDAIELLKGIEDIYGRETTYGIIKDLIKSTPTADVEEVKHGYWTGRSFDWGSEEEYPIMEKSHYLVCSECGHKHFLYIYDFFGRLHKCSTSDVPIIIPNGCPNCLAKMDGGKEE